MGINIQVNAGQKSGTADYSDRLMDSASSVRIGLMRSYLDEAIMRSGSTKPRCLDVGCADGGICAPFATRAELFGLDINDAFVDGAKRNGMTAQAVDFETGRFPHEDESIDIVLSGETIEHVVHTDHLMTEINRVLRPGGHIVFSIPNINQWISFPMQLVFDLPPRYSARFRSPHVRDFTFRTMKKMFRAFGFDILRRSGTGFFVPGINRNVGVAASRLFPRFATELVFLGKKTRRVEYRADQVVDFG